MTTIAIIPARGGSKGIPLKNLAFVGDKPLIDWTLEAAQAAEQIDRIIVSTDSKFIAAHAIGFFGVEALLRPDELSGDDAQIEDAMQHVLNQIPVPDDWDGGMSDEIVLLQPTSPLRRPHDIDGAISQFRHQPLDSLFSATPIFPYVWDNTGGAGLQRVRHSHEAGRPNRQDRRPLLQENGSIYVTRISTFNQIHNRLCGRVGYYRMPPWTAIEIDNYYDIAIANTTIEYYSEVLGR